MHLCRKSEFLNSLLPVQQNRFSQQSTAYTFATPWLKHCHAAYAAIARQSGAAYGFASAVQSQQMLRCIIQTIPLQLNRHRLLVNENLFTHSAQLAAMCAP